MTITTASIPKLDPDASFDDPIDQASVEHAQQAAVDAAYLAGRIRGFVESDPRAV